MQKKLIALAVAGLASSAAFAQSNVTISGNIDMGYRSTSFGTSNIMDTKTAALNNGSSTSSIVFSGKEDIGGGMTVGFLLNTEPAVGSTTNTLFGSESYLELAGGFGSVKAGTVNNTALTVGAAYAQPFGTAIGGGYSSNFGRMSRATTVAAGTGAASVTVVGGEGEITSAVTGAAGTSGSFLVRNSNSLKYTSPDLSGFKLSLQYAAKNSDNNVAAGASQTPSAVELGATYNNGPLNVGFVNYKASMGSVAGTTLGANETVTHNMLAANYTFGPATIYGGWTSSKADLTAGAAIAAIGSAPAVAAGANYKAADSRSWNIALKYAVTGTVNLMMNIVKVDDKLVNNQDRSLTGLGADYALSKRTTAYVRYETGDNDKANITTAAQAAAGVAADGKFTRWGVGLRHTF